MVAGAATAIVIVTEEFPAEHRGWAIGMVGALSATGHGLGAVLFAAYDWLPGGWRALYVLGGAPLLLLPTFRRSVVETRRFADHAASAAITGWHGPLVALAREYPARAAGVAAVSMLLGIGTVSVFQFTGDFVLTAHGWEPGHFSLMLLTAGGLGIIGNIVAGRMGDRLGRRRVGAAFFALFPIFAIVFYNGPSWVLPLAYAGIVFSQTAGAVMLRAISTELFPTSHRGTAAGWATMAETLGWATGLALVGLGTNDLGDIPGMTSLVSISVLVAGATMLRLPETARQELEAISPEHWPDEVR
jgi:putative MFS transporter